MGLLIVAVVNLGSTKLFPKLFPPKFPPIFPGDTACNGSKSCGLASGSGAEDTEAVKQAMASGKIMLIGFVQCYRLDLN
jgi:hypothetical protein